MSIHVMNLVWGSTLKGSSKRFVLLALADRADDEGYCWPSVASICAKTGLCEKTVDRVRRGLEADRILLQETRWRSRGDRDTNGYWINLDALKRTQRPEVGTRGRHPMEVEDQPDEQTEGVGVNVPPPRGRSIPTVGTEVHPYTSVDPPVSHQDSTHSEADASPPPHGGEDDDDPDDQAWIDGPDQERLERLVELIEQHIEGGYDAGEEPCAWDMLCRGEHWRKIVNTINKQRELGYVA